MPTRRSFLKAASGTVAATLSPLRCLGAAIATLPHESSSKVTRLSTGWEYLQGSLGGPWEVWHSEETAVWSKVSVPHSFNAYDACDPDVPYYRGKGWYRAHIDVSNPFADGRTLLHFEGAGQTVAVYVGTALAGQHTGGYDEFVIDITDFLRGLPASKRLPLAILCDNSPDLDRMPSDLSDFSLYGGLYRHLNLVHVPPISIEELHVKTHLDSPQSPADLSVTCSFYVPDAAGRSTKATFVVVITDSDGNPVHSSENSFQWSEEPLELARFSIRKPKLWSPKTPQLYTCTVTLTSATGTFVSREAFGIKHTELIEHGPFLLNGERLLLRGTHRHEDHSGFANAMPDDLIEREMKLIKSMGANFIRLGHYQQSRRVLELCDRLGILVWEEIPWCRSGVGSEKFQAMGKEKLRNMIAQHYNHVSVLFWGLGNEDDWPTEYPEVNKDNIRNYMLELNQLAHQLDPSRYTSFRRCDFARDIPDVYSPSIWAGWYRGMYTEYGSALQKERERVKHFIHIEWGADSHAGRHSENPDRALTRVSTGQGTDERGLDYLSTGGEPRVSKDGDWSETYACNLFDWHLKTQEALPWLMGTAQWIFKDFTTPLRVENPVPRVNQKGLVQRDLTPKEAFFVFQSYWSEEPMARLYGHSWPVRWGALDEKKIVKAYSNCSVAELFVNGLSHGTKTRKSQDFPAAGLRWETTFRPGKNELRVVGRKGAVTVSDSIDFVYQTEPWGKPAELIAAEKSRVQDSPGLRITVAVTLHDDKNVLCLDAKNVVRFSVAGNAKLIDNLGTPSGSRVVQLCNGRAEISVRHGGGSVAVAVTSDGLPTAICTLS